MTSVDEEKNIQSIDYKTMSIEDLITELKNKLENNSIPEIKEDVNAIRASFYYQYNEELEKARALFIEQEGEEAVFEYSKQSLQVSFKELWKQFLEKKNNHHQKITQELVENLEKKESIIENIKGLVEKGDVSSSYKEFKGLQDAWKEIGAITSDKYQETWGNYHLYVEQFYDLLHISNDLRAIDFKHNLEAKQLVIARAKELLEHSDIQFAFNELQVLHRIWKEETGPVSKEFREPIWQEFSDITNAIHDKKTSFFEQLRQEEEKNLAAKLKKLEQIQGFDFSQNKTFGDWKKSIDAFEVLKEEFLAIGKVPKNKTNETWELFKTGTKSFNTAKNDFFKEAKTSQVKAIEEKEALIKEAKEWKDSDDLENATENFKRIQAAWKKVGFVPRKQADALWNEFKTICDAYFERLNTIKKEGTPEQQENYELKVQFLKDLETTEITKDSYLEVIEKWLGIGLVPSQKNNIDQDIQTVISKAVGTLEDKNENLLVKYKIKISYLQSIESRRLDDEYNQLRKENEQITKDLKQLENNLGFFSNSKKGNPLLETALQSVDVEKAKLKLVKLKMKFLKSI